MKPVVFTEGCLSRYTNACKLADSGERLLCAACVKSKLAGFTYPQQIARRRVLWVAVGGHFAYSMQSSIL